MQSAPSSELAVPHGRWPWRCTLPIFLAGVALLLLSPGGLPGSSVALPTRSLVATPHDLGASACGTVGTELAGGCADVPAPSGGTSRVPASVSVVNWTQVCATCGLAARRDAAMAWDPADNYVLLFGGCSGNPCSGAYGDTWKYVGGSWYAVNANGTVPARFGAAMVYDAKDGYMLLFGGCDHNPCYQLMYQDSWSYKAGTWTQLSPATSPPARGAPGMAYDPVDQYTVLFGGWGGSSFLADTWTFAGGTWTQATPSTAPSARDDIGFAWDAKDGYVLLYGGDSNAVQGETWSFLGGQWTELFPAAAPGERSLENDMMTYFSTGQYVVLMGGTVGTGPTCENDTWAWVNQNWLLLHPHSAPSPRGMSILADDPPGGDVIDLGGWTCSTVVGDTWRFNGTIPLVATAAGTPSPTDVGITVAFTATVSGGKAPYSISWRYGDGGVGGGATPSHVFNASGSFTVRCWVNDSGGQKVALSVPMVVDPWPTASLGAVPNPSDVGVRVAFTTVTAGGTSPFNETWRFGDGSVGWTASVAHTYAAPGAYLVRVWANDSAGGSSSPMTNVSVNAVPLLSARATPTITDVGLPLAFSASATGGTGSLTYAWAFGDGVRSPTPNLSHNYSAPGAYTPKVWVNDSIGGTSNTTIPVHIDPLPSIPSVIVLPTPADAGQTLNLSVNSTGGTGRIVYTWQLGDGNVGVGSQISHVYASAGTFSVHVWANDSAGGSTLGVVAVVVAPRPVVTSFVSTPAATDVGYAVSLTVSVSGGSAPFTYIYTRLPTGCSSSSAPTITCDPLASGAWAVQVAARDAAGTTAFGNVSVTVNGLPTVSIVASQDPMDVGGSTNLTANLAGGVAPYTFSWTGLPNGCASVNAPQLLCLPTQAGSFHVNLTVADHLGATAPAAPYLLVVNVVPNVTASASPSTAREGAPVAFHATASGGTPALTLTWRFGDGTSGVGSSPDHAYDTSGTFLAKVWANDSVGSSSSSTVSLTVVPPITVAVTLGANHTAPGSPVEVLATATGGGGTLRYSWTVNGAIAASTAASWSFVPATAGSYVIAVNVTDAYGDWTTRSAVLVVDQPSIIEQQVLGVSLLTLLLILVPIALVALLVALLLVRRRRRRTQGPSLLPVAGGYNDDWAPPLSNPSDRVAPTPTPLAPREGPPPSGVPDLAEVPRAGPGAPGQDAAPPPPAPPAIPPRVPPPPP